MDEPRSILSSAKIFLLLVTVSFGLVIAQKDGSNDISRQCTSKETCSDCIRTDGCAWCSNPGSPNDEEQPIRCMSNHDIDTSTPVCREGWINPIPGHQTVLNEHLFSGDKNNPDRIVQIQPQRIKLQLKPGVPYEVTIKYQQAQDYPVDLYYLMDLSSSMLDDKEKLSALGDNLAKAMQNLTSDFKLGFGSFVDKREMPFVNTVPKKLENPCPVEQRCTSPYSFKNHLPLTSDTTIFSRTVKDAQISGNNDAPEGGFDALMQVIVCTKEIGWRENARHMIVFSTDAPSHYAGDGKLAGIVEPNDGECHMDRNGYEYTHGLLQDYPSVSQINSKAIKHNMNIIFAITQDVNSAYNLLKSRIIGSNSGVLNKDSSNVIKFVADQYQSLEQSVTMTHTAPQSDFMVTFKSKCTNPNGDVIQTDTCAGLRKDTIVEFKAEITALRCHENPSKWNQSFQIKPQALNERMVVDVEVICQCACENPTANDKNYKANAQECTFHGDLQCGVCKCKPGFLGHNCDCSDASSDTQSKSNVTCGGSSSDLECSGRGVCKCGQCVCNKRENPEERIYGPTCNCDNFNSCGFKNGEVCSGKDHGTCNCGMCECAPGRWKGKNCECPVSEEKCIEQPGEPVCSGRGECNCGVCVCKDTDGERYTGKYCEICRSCKGRCEPLKTCVIEHALQQKESNCEGYAILEVEDLKDTTLLAALTQENPSAAALFGEPTKQAQVNTDVIGLEPSGEVYTPDETEPNQPGQQSGFKDAETCSHLDDAGCTYKFRYIDAPNGTTYVFAKKKECVTEVDILAVVLGVIGTILIAGLLLLMIWKIATTLHDRREFAKFENERKNAKWDRGSNPLYVQATSTFSNPTFGGNAPRKSVVPQ